MQTGSRMDEEVVVKLTDEELVERGVSMARHAAEVERLRKKKADDAKSTQALIDVELDEMQRLGRVLLDQAERRKQGDLKFGDIEAAQAITDIAAAAGDTPGSLPSEPHEYVEDPAKPGAAICATCGSDEEDAIHDLAKHLHPFKPRVGDTTECATCGYEEAAMLHRRHAFEVDVVDATDLCGACELAKEDPIHQAEAAASPAEEAPALVDQDTVPGSVSEEESMRIVKERVNGEGPYAFTGDEKPDPIIRTHPAVQP